MIGVGLSIAELATRRAGGPAIIVTDPAAVALITAMTVIPDAARQTLIEQTITAFKTAGVWTKLDVLYLLAAHDAQAARLNWKNPATFSFTATNSPAFTADRGYQGDGAAAFLTATGFNPVTFLGTYTLNVALYGIWVQQASTINSSLDLYLGSGRFGPSTTSTTYQGRINDAASFNIPGAPQIGHHAARRTTATERSGWLAGTSRIADAQVSTTIANVFTLLATGAGQFSNVRIAAAYAGGGFSDADMGAMNTALTTYMTAVGAAP